MTPRYVVYSTCVKENTQYVRDHALIRKFMGLYPSEQDLIKQIKNWWKTKGHYNLQLGSRGFFTITLHNIEYKGQIFENMPYLFNSTSLYLILIGALQPKKGGFHIGPYFDQTLFPSQGILAWRNFG
jgi:hypothetical protein